MNQSKDVDLIKNKQYLEYINKCLLNNIKIEEIFSENENFFYFNHILEHQDYFEELEFNANKHLEFKKEKYYKYYLNMLKIYVQLVKELNITSDLEICNFVAYLLWNGYFNVYGKQVYSIQNYDYTYPIVLGKGCCVDFSILLTDFLNLYGIEAGLTTCFFDKVDKSYKTINVERILKISNNDKIKLKLIKQLVKISNNYGNHAITLINADKLFYYDITNLIAFNYIDQFECQVVGGKTVMKTYPLQSLLEHPEVDLNPWLNLQTLNKPGITKQDLINAKLFLTDLPNNLLKEAYYDAYNDLRKMHNFVIKNKKHQI